MLFFLCILSFVTGSLSSVESWQSMIIEAGNFTNSCGANCTCDEARGLCKCGTIYGASCSGSSGSSGFTTQWIVVVAIVSSIVAAVLIAWFVRCHRERRSARYQEI